MLKDLIQVFFGGLKLEQNVNILIKAAPALVVDESARQVAIDLVVLGAKVGRDELKAALESLYSGYILIWNKGDPIV